jgi:hypothetical protein
MGGPPRSILDVLEPGDDERGPGLADRKYLHQFGWRHGRLAFLPRRGDPVPSILKGSLAKPRTKSACGINEYSA